MNIAGVIKDWMLIFFSYSVFHAPVSKLSLLGYVFCCTGVRSPPSFKPALLATQQRARLLWSLDNLRRDEHLYAPLHPQVMIYNYMKLQVLRAKAAMSTSKDEEKRSGGDALSRGASLDAEPLLAEESKTSAPAHAANGYTNFQCVPTSD